MKTWLLPIYLLISMSCIAHAEETRLRVGVIDTGLDLSDDRFKDVLCQTGHMDLTGLGLSDHVSHGTHVAGIIKKQAEPSVGSYCLVILKYYDHSGNEATFLMAIREAIKQKLSIVNISSGGNQFLEEEYLLFKNNPQIIFVVAAGNDHKNLDKKCYYYPACYDLPNVIPVGALDKACRSPSDESNYGKRVKAWAPGKDIISTLPKLNGICYNDDGSDCNVGVMSGTSMATAHKTGELINEVIKRINSN